MTRHLIIAQDKGGVGKSTLTRAGAEAVPEAKIIEIDMSSRLRELGARVTFFPMRADRDAIERTGGRAARGEYDAVIDAIASATIPTIIDVGANTSNSFFHVLQNLSDDLASAGVEMGVVIVVTSEPGALAEAPSLLASAKTFARARFVVQNQMRGAVDESLLRNIADGAEISTLPEQILDEEAVAIARDGGFATVAKLDPGKLSRKFGMARASRIRRDLARFRLDAMQAICSPANWLIG
ncbi:hypothetical protein [Methylosinus sp. LW4]|uniref:hypothetical protein n=1 Tax=Methylosinus sp. LW4 TaxID=136993 RepID=UPI00036558F9|nr:hypothetical protein [Methylosinus sp. LW4]